MQETIIPHIQSVHCISNHTNLVVKGMSHLLVRTRIESLLHTIYSYFACNPERHLEFAKFVEIMEPNGLKIIKKHKDLVALSCFTSLEGDVKVQNPTQGC